MGKLETLFFSLCILVQYCPLPSLQTTTTEPVNVGFIVALPWDVSNTLRAPLGGPVSIALTVIMAGILLFGLLLAPVNYILGYPSRIYHPARNPGLIETGIYQKVKNKKGRSFDGSDIFTISATSEIDSTFEFIQGNGTQIVDHSKSPGKFPDFVTSAFYFIPEEDDQCRKLILCHAHGFLKRLPKRMQSFFRFFSKRSISISEEYKSAVLLGLQNQPDCLKVYKCSKDLTAILKEILYTLLSSDLKSLWKLRKLF